MNSLLPAISQLECIHIKAKEDKCFCDISDFCILPNGTALLTDHENKCLKRLDNKNRISERLQLSAKPYGICIVDDSTAAVTLHMVKKVQFVTTNTKMSLKSSFSVGDHCRGIAHCYSLLYVCCGGWKAENEGPGHVEVYNTAGTLMKSFDHHLSIPLHITIRKQDSTDWLYIADSNNGLIMMTSKGYVVNIFTHKDMLNYTGVCLGPENQIFVTGLDSNNVAMLAEDGQYVGTIFTKKEGLKEPQSLFYDKKTSKLYVMMVDNDTVKTFDIK
ncbi:uncharacterized protein LOC123523912 [Mercenaria mercenaria]|uniref:uncharacterized protein LOC123523912 n=1 Tax=Mercenaria mercenaria TaxID=6596 RepID=UPI00234F0345|nr:uncharacterized protein LOC123523912 [Mercenaria mercenaria]XP_053395408.1 uncharacterized protein LOC123523912 [Mercenaria mercenaria]